MGIAAYNRGSRAIGEQIYPNSVRHVPAKQVQDDPLPEGILRSSYMPDSDTQIFLSYESRWYRIRTRFQTLKRKRNIDAAIRLFEKVEMYGRCALADE